MLPAEDPREGVMFIRAEAQVRREGRAERWIDADSQVGGLTGRLSPTGREELKLFGCEDPGREEG